MRLSQEKMLALMAFADGELAGEEKAQVEALLAKSEEARGVLEAMGVGVSALAVDAWLAKHGAPSEASKPHPADKVADAVMARIEAERPVVTSLAAAREKRAARVRTFAMVGAAITAIAAAVALVVGGQTPAKHETASTINPDKLPPGQTKQPQVPETAPLPQPEPVASIPTHPVPSVEPGPVNPPQNAVADNEGIEVHEVESPHDVSVIYLPPSVGAAAGMTPQSVVVWLGEGSGGSR